jgi:hypothetical protein
MLAQATCPTLTARHPVPELATHIGRQSFELVLNEDSAMRLVPSRNLVVGLEVGYFRQRPYIDQFPTSTTPVISYGRVAFHFHPCRVP